MGASGARRHVAVPAAWRLAIASALLAACSQPVARALVGASDAPGWGNARFVAGMPREGFLLAGAVYVFALP